MAQSFHELFDPEVLAIPGVREHVPDFQVVLDDVSNLSDEALRARARDVLPDCPVDALGAAGWASERGDPSRPLAVGVGDRCALEPA